MNYNNTLASATFELDGDPNRELTGPEAEEIIRSYVVTYQLSTGRTPLRIDHPLPTSRQYQSILSKVNLQRIDISTRKISPEAFGVLEPFIGALVNVMTRLATSRTRRSSANPVNISLKLGGRMYAGMQSNDNQLGIFEIAANIFRPLPIQKLDLSDTAVGSRLLGMLLSWVQEQLVAGHLKSLKLHNCGLSAENSVSLCDILRLNGINLKELDVGRNRFGDDGAVQFGMLLGEVGCQLESFNYVGNSTLNVGSSALCDGLSRAQMRAGNFQFRELILDEVVLGTGRDKDDNVHTLANVLCNCPELQILGLGSCELEADGLKLVLSSLEISGANVTKLYLADNEFTDDGVDLLVESRIYDDGLCLLDLDGNEISDIGARKLIHNLLPSLKMLSLKENDSIPLNLAEELQELYGDDVLRITFEDLVDGADADDASKDDINGGIETQPTQAVIQDLWNRMNDMNLQSQGY